MSGAVCPSCGVAVVPGYVRCPKCHKALPRRVAIEGGTAVQTSANKGPLIAVVAAVVLGVAALVFWGTRSNDKPAAATPVVTEAPEPAAAEQPVQPAAVEQPAPSPQQPAGPSAAQLAVDLERTLRKQRLWSTVGIVGDRAEVRSGSCEDPAMAPLLDASAPSFKAAGLTKLRCLEQSGRVVTDRDL